MIELYAITDDPAPPEAPVRAVACDGLAVLCAPAEEREVTPDDLWRFEEVVERLMEGRDLLPVRFGTLVSDERAAARAVAERRDELVAGLERVRGAVELAVRADRRDRPEPPERSPSGREYMRAKARRLEGARLIHQSLVARARESVVQPGPEALRAAYLVGRDEVEDFIALVRRLQREHREMDLVCTGPWPPYSFSPGSGA